MGEIKKLNKIYFVFVLFLTCIMYEYKHKNVHKFTYFPPFLSISVMK